MPTQEKIAEIISNLKKVREENGLSYQKIYDLVDASGSYVSISTIRRVFEEGSEAYGFQYDNTLKPIAAAVLGAYSPTDETAKDVKNTLMSIMDYKDLRIVDLEKQISELDKHIQRIEESYKKRIDFLIDQITLKDERIDRRDATMEKLLVVVLEREKYGGVCSVCIARNKAERGSDLPSEVQNG